MPGQVHVAADVWAAMSSDSPARNTLVQTPADCRRVLSPWVKDGIAAGELAVGAANPVASMMLAPVDGFTLPTGLLPQAFKRGTIRPTVDLVLGSVTP
jgi:hypothetical protein